MQIEIIIREKIARTVDKHTFAVCGNSDYTVKFDFDSEWDSYETKTARFKYNGSYTDVPFSGDTCPMPVITNAYRVEIGVYAGELRTSSPALLPLRRSILDGEETEAEVSHEIKDVFGKMLAGKIDAPQVAQVGEVLTVEEVDEDGKPIKWKTEKNVSNNDFVVDVIQKNGIWTSSKTILEIYDAYRAGLRVYALIYDNVIIPLNMSGDSYFVFIGFANMNGYNKCTISDYGTGVNVMWSNTVPEVGWDNITDYFLDEQAFLMCVHDNYAPGGGGLMYYKYGKSSVTTGYRLLALDGNSYDVSYDRRYRELTVKKVLSPLFAPTTAQVGQIVKVKAVDANGKITETETVDIPGEEKWELIKTIDIADGAAETTALTIDTDNNGNAFSLKKCRLFARFPAYTGETTIPNFNFAMINKLTTGDRSPMCYTSGFPKLKTNGYTGTVWEVDVSGLQQYEKVMRTLSTTWSAGVYGSANSQTAEYWGDKRIQSITSIGGAQMIIFPGCHFELYGVRE